MEQEDLFQRLQRSWRFLLLMVVAGGLVGGALNALLPRQYRSEAVLNIGVDYGRSLPLEPEAERHALHRVRELLLADDTLSVALLKLQESSAPDPGIQDVAAFRQRLLLADVGSRWSLYATAGSPETAAAMANAWAESALSSLDVSIRHAVRAAEIQQAIFELGCRLIAADSGQAVWECLEPDGSSSSEPLTGALITEANLSRGILPSLSYSLARQAQPPTDPIVQGRGAMILGGLLTGLFLGLSAVLILGGGSRSVE